MDKSDNGCDGGRIIIDADAFYIGMKPYWLFNITKETRMSKFKVGDRVTLKASVDQSTGWTHGNQYVVTCLYKDEYGIDRIKTNIDDYGSTTNGWLAEYFEPIDAGPVRIVTRQEIVPGTYGKVDVSLYPDGSPCILVSFPKTPDQLREAAHILTQIAEALDDE